MFPAGRTSRQFRTRAPLPATPAATAIATPASISMPATRWSRPSSRWRGRRVAAGADAELGGFGGAVRPQGGRASRPAPGRLHRRRRHQAQARHRGRQARHGRHRPRRHVRQRPGRAGRRAALLPRLLRHRQARGRRCARRSSPGIAEGCREAGCALVGGETAEMPGMYAAGDYDLAGFAVGAVERDALIAGGDDRAGRRGARPRLVGRAFQRLLAGAAHGRGVEGCGWDAPAPFARTTTLAEALLAPTRIYVKRGAGAAARAAWLKALAHITGGGLVENVPRVLPDDVAAELDASAGRCRRSSAGSQGRAASPTPRCCASSIAASAW